MGWTSWPTECCYRCSAITYKSSLWKDCGSPLECSLPLNYSPREASCHVESCPVEGNWSISCHVASPQPGDWLEVLTASGRRLDYTERPWVRSTQLSHTQVLDSYNLWEDQCCFKQLEISGPWIINKVKWGEKRHRLWSQAELDYSLTGLMQNARRDGDGTTGQFNRLEPPSPLKV